MNNLKLGILISIITILALGGFYYLYSKNAAKTQKPKLEATQSSKSNFPQASATASPAEKGDQVQTKFPSSLPETGIGNTQVEGIGIQISSPKIDSLVISPVTVSGTANVPNGLVIQIKDANGQILGVRKAGACFGYQACPFSVSVVFSNPQTPKGQIEVYSPPLSGGTQEYNQTIPVTF